MPPFLVPGMTWPPPEWSVGAAAPGDPLVALPDADLGWPPASWTAEQPDPFAGPELELPGPGGAGLVPMMPGAVPPAQDALAAAAVFPPPEWVEPDQDVLVDDAAGLTEAEAERDALDEDMARMAGSEKTTADLEDDAAAKAKADEDAKIARLADLDPEAWQRVQDERAIARETVKATELRMLAEQDSQRLEEDIAGREKARAAAQADLADIEARTKAMADSSPFESWFESRSTMQKAAGFLAAVTQGYLASRNGGRNAAIDFFMKVAEDDANAKWTKLRERRANAQGQLGAADDDFRMREAIRMASYEQGIRQLEAKLVNLDPQGDAAMRIAGGIRDLRARQAEAAAAAGEQLYKRRVEAYKADSERMRAEADMLRAQAEAAKKLGLGGGGGAGGGVGAGYGSTVTYEQMQANGWTIPAGLKPGQSMNPKAYKAFLDTEAANGRISSSEASRQNAEVERRLKVEAVTVPLPGGVSFEAKTQTEAEKARQKVYAARQLTNYIDELLDIRDKVGGESSWANSPEYGRFQVLAANILKLTKEDTQGMSSDADMAVLKAAAGADNVASFRAQAAKLHRGRDLISAQLNGYLADGQGYTGPPIVFPNMYKTPKPPRDPAADKMASSGPPGMAPPTGDKPAAEILANAGPAIDLDDPKAVHKVLANAPDPLFNPSGARGISEKQNEGLEQLIQGALTGDEAAVRKLVAAGEPGSPFPPAVRRAAKAELGKLAAGRNKVVLKVLAEGDED